MLGTWIRHAAEGDEGMHRKLVLRERLQEQTAFTAAPEGLAVGMLNQSPIMAGILDLSGRFGVQAHLKLLTAFAPFTPCGISPC